MSNPVFFCVLAFVVAAGISEFIKGKDSSCMDVFERADRQMYLRKRELKKEPTA